MIFSQKFPKPCNLKMMKDSYFYLVHCVYCITISIFIMNTHSIVYKKGQYVHLLIYSLFFKLPIDFVRYLPADNKKTALFCYDVR